MRIVLLNSSRNYRSYYQVALRTDFTVAVQQTANDRCKDLIVVSFFLLHDGLLPISNRILPNQFGQSHYKPSLMERGCIIFLFIYQAFQNSTLYSSNNKILFLCRALPKGNCVPVAPDDYHVLTLLSQTH